MTSLENALLALAILLSSALLGIVVYWVSYKVASRITGKTRNKADELIVKYTRQPAKVISPISAMLLAVYHLPLPEDKINMASHILVLLLIAAGGWLIARFLKVGEELIAANYRVDVSDNLGARRVRTQVSVLRRSATVILWLVTIAAAMMTFPSVRNIGAGLFASAGVAGLVLGVAARPVLENLLAGLQIALTQPIRIDDVVVIEGEWGRIEEIRPTFVVVRIWDKRSLVVPLTYFINNPFQNWTRTSAEILGTVFVYTDYSVPVNEVRQELHRILKSSKLWDGKVWNLQITNTNERTVELRALMSASNSGNAWDLRCFVRERLVTFLQQNYPHSLPRTRAELYQESYQPTGKSTADLS